MAFSHRDAFLWLCRAIANIADGLARGSSYQPILNEKGVGTVRFQAVLKGNTCRKFQLTPTDHALNSFYTRTYENDPRREPLSDSGYPGDVARQIHMMPGGDTTEMVCCKKSTFSDAIVCSGAAFLILQTFYIKRLTNNTLAYLCALAPDVLFFPHRP